MSRHEREVVHRIALEIADERIPAGDRAELRQGDRQGKRGPAFWKVAVRHLEPAGLLRDDEAERRWAAILAGLARHPGSHAKDRRLGVALAEADVAEARVLRLARAHGDSLHKAVRAVAQQLASSGLKVDWGDFADLITSDGAPWEDEVRRRMCRDFYRTERSSQEGPKEEKS